MTDQMHAAPERDDAASPTQQPQWAAPASPPVVPPEQPYGQSWPTQPWPTQQPSGPYSSFPPAQPQQKSRFGLGMLVGFVLGVAAALVGLFILGLLFSSAAPASLGDSERTDSLYEQCDAGDMVSCDTLYMESAIGSDLEEFGATCGGRVAWQDGDCVGADVGLE